MMTNMNGPTSCKEIRSVGYTGIIIGVTGNITTEGVINFKMNGADQVLKKPLDVDELIQIVNSMLKFSTKKG